MSDLLKDRLDTAAKLAELINDAHPDGLGECTIQDALPVTDALAHHAAAAAVKGLTDAMRKSRDESRK